MAYRIIFFLLLLNPISLISQGLYDDPRLKNWNQYVSEGKYVEVMTSVESDLLKDNPHPFAANIWFDLRRRTYQTEDILDDVRPEIREKVKILTEIKSLYNKGQEHEIIELYPIEKVEKEGLPDYYCYAYLELAADDLHNYEYDYQISLLMLQDFPETFLPAWNLFNIGNNHEQYRLKLLIDIQNGSFDNNPTVKKFLLATFRFRPSSDYEELEAVNQFLTEYPSDAYALRFRAWAYKGIEKYPQAAEDFLSAGNSECINKNNFNLSAENYALQFKYSEAEQIIKTYINRYANQMDTASLFIAEWAECLRKAGEKGKAREVLTEGIDRFPNSIEINYEFGLLELESKRAIYAIPYLEKAYSSKSWKEIHVQKLLEAYRDAGEIERGINLFQKVKSTNTPAVTPNLYHEGIELYLQSEVYDEAINLNQEAIIQYPESSWMLRNLANIYFQKEQIDKSLKALNISISIYRPYSWSVNLFTTLLENKYTSNTQEIEKELRKLIPEFYWVEEIWKKIAERQTSVDSKIAVWEEAINLNPGRLFPYRNVVQIFLDKEQWDEINDVLINAEKEVEIGSREDRIDIYFEKGIYLVGKLRKSNLTKDEIASAFQNFKLYKEFGGYEGAYYTYLAELYSAIGDKEKAAETTVNAIYYRPNNAYLPDDLIKYSSNIAHKMLYEFWSRDPYDQTRLSELIRYHIYYPGSSISALNLIHEYENLFGEKLTGYEQTALEKLGQNAKDYSYHNSRVIGTSQRYINWYNSTRHNYWRSSSVVSMDYETNTATITLPDGTIYQQQDNLKLGKIKRAQIGDSYIELDYDNYGNLILLSSSNGTNIEIQYDSLEHISSIVNSDGQQLTYEYNEKGKPEKIEVRNLGYLKITYDEYGEVTATEAYNTKGEQAVNNLAYTITNAFQNLLSTINKVKAIHSINNAQLPDLGFVDEIHEKLSNRFDEVNYEIQFADNPNKSKSRNWLESSLQLAEYDINHTHIDTDYTREAYDKLTSLFNWVEGNNEKWNRLYGVEAIRLFHQLLQKTRKQGVSQEYWKDWIAMQEWLESEKITESSLTDYRLDIESLQKDIADNPVTLLASSEWLPKSWLNIYGHWKRYRIKNIVPIEHQDGLLVNNLLYRKNGHIVVGTNKGISVFRRGYWEWFGYHPYSREMRTAVSSSNLKGSSNVQCLAEDEEGNLYMGTTDGLLIIGEDYEGPIKFLYSELDGLPSRSITSIGILGNKILIGTIKGGAWLENENIIKNSDFAKAEFKYIRDFASEFIYDPSVTLVGTQEGVYYYVHTKDSLELEKIVSESRDDAYFFEGSPYTLKGDEVSKVQWNEEKQEWNEISIFGNIITTDAKQVFGLTQFPVNEEEQALGVLTDFGVSLYHEKHFEHFKLPDAEGNVLRAKYVDVRADAFAVVTDEEILTFGRENTITYKGKIYDLLTSNKLGVTFVADDNTLKYFRHQDPNNELHSLGSFYQSTTSLALDHQDRLIANDGLTINRYTYDSINLEFFEEELFYCNQTEAEANNIYPSGSVNNILVASDGSIWVSTRLAVFRYNEIPGKKPVIQEYNFFRDPISFPSKTDMVSKIFETINGEILVVCSNESHRNYNGISLEGGLLRWNEIENRFERLNVSDYKERGYNWFITAYTQVNDKKAIVGTLGGFAEDNFGEIKDYWSGGGKLQNVSYESLSEKYPNLFLGTQGALLGDLWLFGCANGVVAYYDGIWFYPDRLNQLLPDDAEFGNYGGRHVNAIATDPFGKIYIGTDLGLLVYETAGEDATDLLLQNIDPQTALIYQSVQQLQNESKNIIANIPEESNAGKLIAEIGQTEKELDKLHYQKAKNQIQEISAVKKPMNVDSLTVLIENVSKRHTELLLRLQQTEPAIWQLLAIPPLDLATHRKRMNENECIVQYIPMSKKLFIQVLSKKMMMMQEVDIDRKTLMDTCLYMAKILATEAKNARGVKPVTTEEDSSIMEEKLNNSLLFLFDLLLRPIYKEISGYDNIVIVPTGALAYVPFSALAYKTEENTMKYAVEDHNFGYTSSLYLLDLVYNYTIKCDTRNLLLMGDPDGSLPGARKEGDLICSITNTSQSYYGNRATTKNLLQYAQEANIIHLATHGYLDRDGIESSWILFADKKLTMAEAYNLPLDNTNMVVLSACETGLGKKGLEYATIARAFANAGTPSIMASLWAVNDEATQILMGLFYENLLKSNDKFFALSEAQRSMLQSTSEFEQHPAMWASFIPIGKPD